MNIEQFKEEIQKRKFFISDKNLFMLYSAINQKPVSGAFLFGPAGVGKTEVAQIVGDVLDTDTFYYQMFPNSKEDDLLIRFGVNEHGDIVSLDGVLIEMAKFLQNNPDKRATLILDEYDKSRPSADNFLLDILQNGRIRYAGRKYNIDLDRVIVFIISNNFRDFSEPFMRRLPKIDIEVLPVELVIKILKEKYNIYDENLLKLTHMLYIVGLQSKLKKPITVQELNQFITAYKILGDKSDINSLIYSYLIKDPDDYYVFVEKLKDFNFQNSSFSQSDDLEVSEIIEDKFNNVDVETSQSNSFVPKFPNIFFPEVTPVLVEDKEKETVYGVIPYTDRAYHYLSDLFINMEGTVEKNVFDDIFVVSDVEGERQILQKKCLDISGLKDYSYISNLTEDKILGNSGNLFLTKKKQFVPFDFKQFVKFLLLNLKDKREFKAEIVYLSEIDSQVRIKCYDPYSKDEPAIDSFIYFDNDNNVVNEMIVFGKCNSDIMLYYLRSVDETVNKLIERLQIQPKKIQLSIDEQLQKIEKSIKDKMNVYTFLLFKETESSKILVIDLKKHFQDLYDSMVKQNSVLLLKQEVDELLDCYPDKVYLSIERDIDSEKFSKSVNFVVYIPYGKRHSLSNYIKLNNSNFKINIQDFNDSVMNPKSYIYHDFIDNAESFEKNHKKRFVYNETMNKISELMFSGENNSKEFYYFNMNISLPNLSYEQMENIVIHNVLESIVNDVMVKFFSERLNNTIDKYKEQNKIFNSLKTDGKVCNRRKTK